MVLNPGTTGNHLAKSLANSQITVGTKLSPSLASCLPLNSVWWDSELGCYRNKYSLIDGDTTTVQIFVNKDRRDQGRLEGWGEGKVASQQRRRENLAEHDRGGEAERECEGDKEGGREGRATHDFDWQLQGENVSQHPEPHGSNKTLRIHQHIPALLFMKKTGTRQAPGANPASALHIYKSSLNCFSPARNKDSLCSRNTHLN